MSEEPCPEHKVIRREVLHVANTYQLKAASVRSENVVSYQLEYGFLPDLVPHLQVLETTALAEVEDQFYETLLHKEVCHSLSL